MHLIFVEIVELVTVKQRSTLMDKPNPQSEEKEPVVPNCWQLVHTVFSRCVPIQQRVSDDTTNSACCLFLIPHRKHFWALFFSDTNLIDMTLEGMKDDGGPEDLIPIHIYSS